MYTIASKLILNNANVNCKSKNLACQSLLHHYSSRGRVNILKLLISSKSFNIEESLEEALGPLMFTPLHMAARGGRVDACQYLIECGASILCVDKNGQTPADLAEKNGKNILAASLREEK